MISYQPTTTGKVSSFTQQLLREWRLIRKDGWLGAMVSWLPLSLFILMWGIFSVGIARDLPIGVVDLDHSKLSRQLIRQYDASPVLSVTAAFPSIDAGSHALRGGDIYALLVIPSDLESHTLLGMAPTVTTFYNSQFILIGKLVHSAVAQAQGTLNAQIDTLKYMVSGDVVPRQALGQAVPLQSQVTPLYNSNSDYGQFLVSALIPAIWQIAIVVTTIMALAAEQRGGGMSRWLNHQPVRNLLAKLLPYTVLFVGQGMLFLLALYGLLGWPMHGHWSILLIAQCLMVVACQGIACLLYLLPLDATKAMSLAAGLTAPAFAFVGITFPATNMPILAQWWRAILPVSHYLEVQVYQVNQGQSWQQATPQLIALLLFAISFLVVVWRIRQLAGRQEAAL
ncbi:ABC transporter permease [Photobacterium nomapromontoriensis]|uniref:ABC transporter permease n=1 Tax=Photobacterium nomapromontoriensis TaxID=2910237 RepID=UPI003D0B5AFD